MIMDWFFSNSVQALGTPTLGEITMEIGLQFRLE
jgi:hypothetical protein